MSKKFLCFCYLAIVLLIFWTFDAFSQNLPRRSNYCTDRQDCKEKLVRADKLFISENYSEALILYQEIYQQTQEAVLLSNIGRILHKQTNYNAALISYNDFLAKDRSHPDNELRRRVKVWIDEINSKQNSAKHPIKSSTETRALPLKQAIPSTQVPPLAQAPPSRQMIPSAKMPLLTPAKPSKRISRNLAIALGICAPVVVGIGLGIGLYLGSRQPDVSDLQIIRPFSE